jgi:hypothetical protein
MIENIAEKGCGDLSESNIVSTGKNAAHRIIASSKDFAIFQVQRIINPDFKKNIPSSALIQNPEPAMWTVLEAEESLLVYQKMLPRRTQLELIQPLQSIRPVNSIEDKITLLLSTNLTIDKLSLLLFADKDNIEKNYMHYEARQELTDVVIYEKIFSLIKDGRIKIRRNYEDLSAEMPYIEYECQMLSKRLGAEDDKPSELIITFFNQQSEKSIASIILKGEEVKTAESLAMIRQKELLETAEESSQDKLQKLFEEGLKAIEDDMSRDDMESWSRINKAETIKDDFYSILTGLIQNFHIPGYIYVEVSQNEAYKNRISKHLDKILGQPDVLAYLLFNYSKSSYNLEVRKDIDNLISIQNLFKQKETSMHDESLVKLLENNPSGLIEQVKKNIGGKFMDKIYNISDGKSEKGTIILKKINDDYFLFLILLKKTEKDGVSKISVKKELLDSINELKLLIDGK